MASAASSPEIDLHQSQAFARLTGDWNPVHLDERTARRSIFAGTVAHGLHAALWGLNETWRGAGPRRIEFIELAFPQPLRRGESLAYSVAKSGNRTERIVITAGAKTVAELSLRWNDLAETLPNSRLPSASFEPVQPNRRLPGESQDLEGRLPLVLPKVESEQLFPHLTRSLPAAQFATILSLTRIVGMECPGLNSIFVNARIEFSEHGLDAEELRFRCRSVHPVTGYARVDVENECASGQISAAFRPEPVQQPSFRELQERVPRDAFADRRALVAGGSRGLGEIVAKLLCAGGAEVLLTYHTGADDARRVVEECSAGGARVAMTRYDASDPSSLDDELLSSWDINLLCYFATPPILMHESTEFDPSLFARYCDVYVNGFWAVWDRVSHSGQRAMAVLYPSSIAVEEIVPAAAEYASAKSAAETLCRHIEHTYPSTSITKPRLPRLPTDQTVSVLPYEYPDAAALLLDILLDLETN